MALRRSGLAPVAAGGRLHIPDIGAIRVPGHHQIADMEWITLFGRIGEETGRSPSPGWGDGLVVRFAGVAGAAPCRGTGISGMPDT